MGCQVGDRYQYSGAVHMHTTESDGALPLKEVAEIGREAGLDFMMVTDHVGLTNREAGLEGLYGTTLVVIGYEHNDVDDNNHYLIFKSPGVYGRHLTAREYVEAAHRDGAFGIVAHPIEHRSREGKYPPYPWTDWEIDQFDGLEIWNQMSEWMEKLNRWNRLIMAFSPRKSMVGPPQEALAIWDKLNEQRRYVGVAGVDAHEFLVDVGPLKVKIFPYKVHFRSLRTHIILDEPMASDFPTAARQFYRALAGCRVYNSNYRWGCADRFNFMAHYDSQTAVSGDSVPWSQGIRLVAEIPSRADVRLYGNGRLKAQAHTQNFEFAVQEPGLYRLEVWKRRRGWIFSNHIRIGIG